MHGAIPCAHPRLPAYAHNDYYNARPLADALALGYRGVEVDLFLLDGELRVGHDLREARANGTAAEMYLAPLADVVARCGSPGSAAAPFLLNIELKEERREAFDSLAALLRRHPIGRTEGVAVTLVGWHPSPDALDAAAFDDAGLQFFIDSVAAPPSPRHRLASLDYGKSIGRWWRSAKYRREMLRRIRGIKQDHPGVLVRVFNVPTRSTVYAQLLEAGVDFIGTRELTRSSTILLQFGGPSHEDSAATSLDLVQKRDPGRE